ncbi:hypothetical protein JCM5296_003164 [Sporobolomyces johnsonii]
MSKYVHELTDKFEKLPGKLDRLKESVAYAVNPNHRHDEPDEKAEDEMRAAIAASHRFNSFADVREGNDVKFYLEGHDYFYALSEILENAKEVVFILDWWLTPELYLRRPPTEHEDYRLDRLLLRKAEQGVKIYIVVYKEVTQTMTMSSSHTKHALEDLHPNIAVMRHPDHIGGEVTLYWSHHEKLVVVDNTIACIGGLDLCFGRWDTSTHPLADVHPTDFSRTLFPGQDFNNARIQDFQQVDKWASNQQSRLETARMPWSDVHSMLMGPAVMDICQHFIERWNFVANLKYKGDKRYPILAFPHVTSPDDDPQQSITRHPHLHRFAEMGKAFHIHTKSPEEGGWDRPQGGLGQKGSVKVQVLRSSADWSHGIEVEHSIQNAYCQAILEASHFIFITNQFFISSTNVDQGPVKNVVAQAIVNRVLSAAQSGQKFRIVIIIPAVPGFAGDLSTSSSSGTLAIMGATYRTICRGPQSIFGQLQQASVDPNEFISVFNLRSYDRINSDPKRLQAMKDTSGISFEEAQAALARVNLGREANKDELAKNKEVTFEVPQEGGEVVALDVDERAKPQNKNPLVTLPLPQSYDEAWERVHRFEQADIVREQIADSVAHHAQAGTGSLLDEPWSGDEESERNAYVTEETYIHSKLMIIDDRRVIMGSANLNDRSQNGDRDSEIACMYEDEDLIESRMDGKPYMAARFAATLRRKLWKNHLGLSPPQFCPSGPEEPVTAAMRMVGIPQRDETNSREDQLVMDPLSTETEQLWKSTAEKNAAIFDDVFHCVPSAKVETWEQYKAFVPQHPIRTGHVADLNRPIQDIKEQLDQVRGHLVAMPLNFLCKEHLLEFDASVNPVTISIYL